MNNVPVVLNEIRLDLENLRRTVESLVKGKPVVPAAKKTMDSGSINVVNTYIELPKVNLENLLEIVREAFDLGAWEVEELFRHNPDFTMHRTIRDVVILALSQMGWQLRDLKELFRMQPETISEHIKQIRRRIVAEPGLKEEYRELVSGIRNFEAEGANSERLEF